MSLENLVKINQLQHHTTNPEEVQRLIAAATRNLADSRNESVSDQTRFDAAYKTIMQCALLGLMANGYRPSTTTPGFTPWRRNAGTLVSRKSWMPDQVRHDKPAFQVRRQTGFSGAA
jgi:hypothetical protein